jgi:4-hydroxythreonine-4-phosphate dehydrogenase
MAEAPRLIFTLGDPSGIGPEVVLKALLPLRLGWEVPMAVVGPAAIWELAARELGVLPPQSNGVEMIEPSGERALSPEEVRALLFSGRPSVRAARIALAALRTACDLVAAEPDRRALVTAPLNKAAFHAAGEQVPGHTEWLAERLGAEMPVMLLVGARLRVALLTTHLPVRQVAEALELEGILKRLRVLDQDLRRRFALPEPRIAMLALNPHGGMHADAGREEREILQPALERARAEGIAVEGLFSADSFFGRRQWSAYDAVVSPFHDQGLVPVKMEAAGAGVNVTLGLPIVRTSPDHGTAFDIAGRGIASESAMLAAARLAHELIMGRGVR